MRQDLSPGACPCHLSTSQHAPLAFMQRPPCRVTQPAGRENQLPTSALSFSIPVFGSLPIAKRSGRYATPCFQVARQATHTNCSECRLAISGSGPRFDGFAGLFASRTNQLGLSTWLVRSCSIQAFSQIATWGDGKRNRRGQTKRDCSKALIFPSNCNAPSRGPGGNNTNHDLSKRRTLISFSHAYCIAAYHPPTSGDPYPSWKP